MVVGVALSCNVGSMEETVKIGDRVQVYTKTGWHVGVVKEINVKIQLLGKTKTIEVAQTAVREMEDVET